jgi:hypothetical protein
VDRELADPRLYIKLAASVRARIQAGELAVGLAVPRNHPVRTRLRLGTRKAGPDVLTGPVIRPPFNGRELSTMIMDPARAGSGQVHGA